MSFWACRACLNFNQKWNSQLRDTHLRQDETDKNIVDNRKNIEENRKSIEEIRRLAEEVRNEARQQNRVIEGLEERVENAVADELREREARKLNLVFHGVPEIEDTVRNPKERMEMDKGNCGKIIQEMRIRSNINLRFCRRIVEKGREPRPVVIGLFSEEDRKRILDGARELRYTRYENVTVVPDLTKSQRRGEQRLREEADRRNTQLTAEDREKNLKWIVVGKRGEKRLIKGVERENQHGRADRERRPSGNRNGGPRRRSNSGGWRRDGGERRNRSSSRRMRSRSGDRRSVRSRSRERRYTRNEESERSRRSAAGATQRINPTLNTNSCALDRPATQLVTRPVVAQPTGASGGGNGVPMSGAAQTAEYSQPTSSSRERSNGRTDGEWRSDTRRERLGSKRARSRTRSWEERDRQHRRRLY